MKESQVNNTFDKNRSINILNIEFENDESSNNNSKIKNSLNNSIISKIKSGSSKEINTNNKNKTLNENYKISPIYNKEEKDKIINKKKILNKISNSKPNKSNIFPNSEIKKTDLEFSQPNYKDKSCKNWDEVTNNFIEHVKNEQILKKLENKNINKGYFDNNQRKYYFGRHKIDNLPYVYDISSTYMNNYYNKSEHMRHEILIDELCKLRAYLIKYPNNNNIDIIKDFLIKYNIQNIEKYSNFQLLQLGKFVCQEDIYKINSLLKPYLHVKDMIYDILENSITLNNKFCGYKFNASIDKLLNKISSTKNQIQENDKNFSYSNKIIEKINKNRNRNKNKDNLNIKSTTIFENKPKNKNNKKFYISELDYTANSNDNNNNTNKIEQKDNDNIGNNGNVISNNDNKNNENDEDEEKCEEIKNKNHKEFISYSKKRKELLDSIGIYINRQPYQNVDGKDLYSSPLLKKNKKLSRNKSEMYLNKRYNIKNTNSLFLPKINNKVIPYYKPNKLLLAPDKNYSDNFNLLLKDISNELKDFEYLYQQKLDMIGKRNLSHNNSKILSGEVKNKNIKNKFLAHSQSCDLYDKNDIDRIKKMEAVNRLYYGKKSIKIDLGDIQKKHKLTEYIALANAKTHVKNDIINENVLK